MSRIAIVGSGIAGLGLAYYLRDKFHVTVFEKDDRSGGHSNTVEVLEQASRIPIDTGFMVFNKVTYPNLVELFTELAVPIKTTDMSFSVQSVTDSLEYSGASFRRLFGDLANIANARFWRLLKSIDRFNKEGGSALASGSYCHMTLSQYASSRGYGNDFLRLYLLPMSSALWSTPPEQVAELPIETLLRFFSNHGLLGQNTQHQWYTVDGGSAQYVRRLLAKLPETPRLSKEVVAVHRHFEGAEVITADGESHTFDIVVLACHADQARLILRDQKDRERQLLSAFDYKRNDVLLHTDAGVMPRVRRCWASWNYRADAQSSTVHYWMNSLQDVSGEQNYFVTLNGDHLVASEKIIKRMVYHHPVFNFETMKAQKHLHELNAPGGQVFFCGSYFGYGFHEDALASSRRLARQLEGVALCR